MDEYENLRRGMRQMAERIATLEATVERLAPLGEPPKRLPTSSPSGPSEYERSRRALRAKVLAAWAEGYGNRFIGRQYSPAAPGVKDHLDAIIGMGGEPDDVLRAAKFMAEERWWEAKGAGLPGLSHFAKFYEKYSIRARESSGVSVNAAEKAAYARQEAERRRKAEAAEEKRRMAPEAVGAAAEDILAQLKGTR